tara:strand:- start:252 stop:395 length:144 start_codon:yes stop_codon:yes gene_type:complete
VLRRRRFRLRCRSSAVTVHGIFRNIQLMATATHEDDDDGDIEQLAIR